MPQRLKIDASAILSAGFDGPMEFVAMLHAARVGRILTYAAMIVGIVMLLGSCDYKTRRYAGPTVVRAPGFNADEFDQWAALTALSSLVAITLLGIVMATIAPRHGGLPGSTTKALGLATIALGMFALGASTAQSYWTRVVGEQQRATYEVQIAYGLPTVTFAGVLGAAVCVLLIVSLLAANRVPRQP